MKWLGDQLIDADSARLEWGGDPKPVERRSVVYVDGRHEAPVFRRDALRAGHRIAGPAIIEEAASVTVLNSGRAIDVDRFGNLAISRVR